MLKTILSKNVRSTHACSRLEVRGRLKVHCKWFCHISLSQDEEYALYEEPQVKVRDISEPISSSNGVVGMTTKDYYSQYSDSFFKDSYQKMMKSIEQTDEFNPQFSLTKKYEEESIVPIEPGVAKTPSSILKVTLKVTAQHLGGKKRVRLDEYLFRRLIFAVFHRTEDNANNAHDEHLMAPIQLRFRLFDRKARKRARQTLRKFRREQIEQKRVERESIGSPLTLTEMKLSRGMINRFTTEHGAIINDLVHIFRPSFKIKEHDELTCYIPYSFLLEQYHRRIAQLFMDTLRADKCGDSLHHSQRDEDDHDDDMNVGDESDGEMDNDRSSDDGEEHKSTKHIEGDRGLRVYDIEREVMRIDAELIRDHNESTATGTESEYEGDPDFDDEDAENEDSESLGLNDLDSLELDESREHQEELERLSALTPRTVTNRHVYEWLQLIGQQIVPSETLITKKQVYTKHDVVLYEDDDIMVINKPPNIAVHPTFSTGCDFSNSLVNFLLFHCPELREMQNNAVRSFHDATFEDLLLQSKHIEDEHDINLFYNNMMDHNIHSTMFRSLDEDDADDQRLSGHEKEDRILNSPLEDIMKPGIVHRIDKRTSGLLVVGKTMASCRFLMEQFSEHTIGREYLALTHNKLPKELWTEENYIERHPVHRTQFSVMRQPQRSPFSLLTRDDVKDENAIRAKLGRISYEEEEALKKEKAAMNVHATAAMSKEQREMMKKLKLLNAGDVTTEMLQQFQAQQGKQQRMKSELEQRQKNVGTARLAVTHFRELEQFEYTPKKLKKTHRFSLLNCQLGTGRTHQVRVHCHHMKLPIIGDNNYFVREYRKYEQELFDEIRHFQEMHYLHAYLLRFKHINGRVGQFTANPPEMFTKVLGRLRTMSIMAD